MTSTRTPAPVAPAVAPFDVAAATARVQRASKITIDSDSPRTPIGAYGTAYVTTGTRPIGDQQEDVLVIVDGSTRVAFPASAVAVALMHGIVPRDAVRALWAAIDNA